MANNRLWLQDTETGEEILLCKSMGDGWYFHHSTGFLTKWLDGRDTLASIGNCEGNTVLIIYAENEK